MYFFITGPIVPYVRMTQRSKYANPRARDYNANQMIVKMQLRDRMREHNWEMIPRGVPLQITVWVKMSQRLHISDLDNQLKAVLDGLQGVVFEDDRWCDKLTVLRWLGDEDKVTVWVSEYESRL